MIAGLVEILVFQGLGELASRFLVPLIPGPVIGLLLLALFLTLAAYHARVVIYERAGRHPLANPVAIAVPIHRSLKELRGRIVPLFAAVLTRSRGQRDQGVRVVETVSRFNDSDPLIASFALWP